MVDLSVDLSTLGRLLAFAGTTGIITTILNQASSAWRETRRDDAKRKSEAGYLALRLATLLAGYAYDCMTFIDRNMSDPPKEKTLPPLPPFPDEGWHSIDLKLAARVLDLRNHLAGSQGKIDSVDSPDRLGDELDEQAASRGKEAWDLAKDLRARHGLPAFEPVQDFTAEMEWRLKEAKRAKAERWRRHMEKAQNAIASMNITAYDRDDTKS